MKFNYFLFLFMMVFLLNCANDDDVITIPEPDPVEKLVFEGVKMFDANGEAIGCYGECGDDWTNFALTAEEMDYLDLEDNIDLSGFENNLMFEYFSVYPIPIGNNGNVNISLFNTGVGKMKLALVNECREVEISNTLLIDSDNYTVTISSEIFQNLDRKQLYRLFYSIYDLNDELVFSGFGDVSICTEDNNPTIDFCFE